MRSAYAARHPPGPGGGVARVDSGDVHGSAAESAHVGGRHRHRARNAARLARRRARFAVTDAARAIVSEEERAKHPADRADPTLQAS